MLRPKFTDARSTEQPHGGDGLICKNWVASKYLCCRFMRWKHTLKRSGDPILSADC